MTHPRLRLLPVLLAILANGPALACPPLPAGQVPMVVDPQTAVTIAWRAMLRGFSGEAAGQAYLAQYMPYTAERRGDAWQVYGYLPPGTVGGTPQADVCRADGSVENVLHGQ